jgi:hypothetical protein
MPAPGVTTILAKYSLSVNDRYRVYLLAQDDTSLNSETPRFLVPSVDGVDVRNHFLLLPLDRIPARKGVVFIVIGDNDRRLAAIRSQYPRGLEEVQRNAGGQIALNPSMAIARD